MFFICAHTYLYCQYHYLFITDERRYNNNYNNNRTQITHAYNRQVKLRKNLTQKRFYFFSFFF